MATTVRIPIDLRTPQFSANEGNSFWNVNQFIDWDAGFWEFAQDVDGKVFGVVGIPPNVAATPAAKLVLVVAANATSGVTRLNVASAAVADGETLNPSALTDETAQDITVPATAYLREDVTFSLTPSLAANDLLIVEVFHEGSHANDTLATATVLVEAWLEVDVD